MLCALCSVGKGPGRCARMPQTARSRTPTPSPKKPIRRNIPHGTTPLNTTIEFPLRRRQKRTVDRTEYWRYCLPTSVTLPQHCLKFSKPDMVLREKGTDALAGCLQVHYVVGSHSS